MLGFLQAMRAIRPTALGATTSRNSFSAREPSMPEQLEALNKLLTSGNEASQTEENLKQLEHHAGSRCDRQLPKPAPTVLTQALAKSSKPTEELSTNDDLAARATRTCTPFTPGC